MTATKPPAPAIGLSVFCRRCIPQNDACRFGHLPPAQTSVERCSLCHFLQPDPLFRTVRLFQKRLFQSATDVRKSAGEPGVLYKRRRVYIVRQRITLCSVPARMVSIFYDSGHLYCWHYFSRFQFFTPDQMGTDDGRLPDACNRPLTFGILLFTVSYSANHRFFK